MRQLQKFELGKATMKTKIIQISIIGGILALFIYSFNSYLNLPIVQTSWTTKKCVNVIPANAGTCKNLPNKYHHEYIR